MRHTTVKWREITLATIRASCPTCGDVELTTGDVQVRVCSTNNEGAYLFACPECQMSVTKPADHRIVDLLVASGVRLSVWQLPAELDEPRHGPPISYDDLLEFHFELQQEGWLDHMATPTAVEDR
jgi:hypothetical protein